MDILSKLIADALAGVTGGVLGGRYHRRRLTRLARRGVVPCAMRLVTGSQPGVWTRWRLGTAKLAPGVIEYRGLTVPVLVISQTHQRSPSARELLTLDPEMRIVDVVNDTAKLEWALPTTSVAWALRKVKPVVGG
ncbi:MAG: hypothetical protein QOE97_2725 [Pseudonocardiales bacterium]|jgi:hypothetical protein|nr:hypothetical protein [Pseudonocardiales bacterium]